MFFTLSGPTSGPLRDRDHFDALCVMQDTTGTPAGLALHTGVDEAGVSLWKLIVNGSRMPGEWMVINREFLPATSPIRHSPRPEPPRATR